MGHPSIEDRLVRAETREEMVRGRLTFMPAAEPEAASRHTLLNFVLRGHMAPGYVVWCHLLTRAGPNSDFATSTCLGRDGIDPSTGTRYLEELAFYVVSDCWPLDLRERVEDLSARGVRRLFAIFIERHAVAEWSAAEHRWVPLLVDGFLVDPTLTMPLPIRALLDDEFANAAVLAALHTKRDRLIADGGDLGPTDEAVFDALSSRNAPAEARPTE